MTAVRPQPSDRCVLLFALHGDELEACRTALAGAGLLFELCPDAETLGRPESAEAAALVLAERGLDPPLGDAVAALLRDQPEWSDFPVLVLADPGQGLPLFRAASARVANLTVLERPICVVTLVTALRSALRARQRQYQLRDRLNQLRETEQRFRSFADATPVLVWVNDPRGVEFMNREGLRFLGRTLDEVRGTGWQHAVHPDDRESYARAFAHAYEQRARLEAEVRMRRADGEYRWLRSMAAPRFDADGTFLGYVGCAMDITDSKLSEAHLLELDRRKDEFLATLAHELRNPLAPIRYSLQLLRMDRQFEASTNRVLDMMDRQVRQMDRLVDDLLEISRIALGRIELRLERVDLASILRSAIEGVTPLISAAHHQLTVSLPGEPLPLEADAGRLTQVFSNLLNNATRYTRDGGRITLEVRRDGDHASVMIRDNGMGIPAELLPYVFDRFARQERQRPDMRGGLGIGLTLVKQLVEMHQGDVHAASDGPGTGSTFTVRLPLAIGAPGVSTGPKRAAVSRSRAITRRVLVVDDNQDAADSLAALLESLGVDARVAYDGPSALVQIAEARPSVALLDIGMPEMDGYELARRIRADPVSSDMLLVAVTGWGHPEARRKSREAGFDHHLVKPVALDVVRSLLLATEVVEGRPAS